MDARVWLAVASFKHLIGCGEERRRYGRAERVLEIDDHLEVWHAIGSWVRRRRPSWKNYSCASRARPCWTGCPSFYSANSLFWGPILSVDVCHRPAARNFGHILVAGWAKVNLPSLKSAPDGGSAYRKPLGRCRRASVKCSISACMPYGVQTASAAPWGVAKARPLFSVPTVPLWRSLHLRPALQAWPRSARDGSGAPRARSRSRQ
jgi:hypothetical protein